MNESRLDRVQKGTGVLFLGSEKVLVLFTGSSSRRTCGVWFCSSTSGTTATRSKPACWSGSSCRSGSACLWRCGTSAWIGQVGGGFWCWSGPGSGSSSGLISVFLCSAARRVGSRGRSLVPGPHGTGLHLGPAGLPGPHQPAHPGGRCGGGARPARL